MRPLAAVAASLAFTLAAVALLQGFAGLAGDSARVSMRAWEETGRVSEREQWELVYSRLNLARQLSPLNADYSADLGRLMEWQSWQQSPGSADFAANRALADDYYLGAIIRRPSWGYAWVHYAENQLLRGRLGIDFQTALRNAIELSPWEPGVQRKVARIGMAAWDVLPGELRDSVRDTIERAVELDVHRHEIVRLAVQFDWLHHLKPMMRSESQMATLEFVLKQIDRR